jgi:hypothetical protein
MRQRAHFVGTDHVGFSEPARHLIYTASTNTWTRQTNPPFSGTILHAWEGNTCDVRGRQLYRINLGGFQIWRMNLDTLAWSNLGAPSTSILLDPGSGIPGMAIHYTRGSAGQLLLAVRDSGTDGAIAAYDIATNTWTRLQGGLSGFAAASGFAEYSEVHHVTFFGGSGGPPRVINTAGTITTAPGYPACGPSLNRNGILHGDPGTGNIVMLCGGSAASWHIFNPTTNAWTTKATPGSLTNHILNFPSDAGTWPTWGVIGIPITDHGVIMYVKCNGGGCGVRLYKGGMFTLPVAPAAPTGLIAG